MVVSARAYYGSGSEVGTLPSARKRDSRSRKSYSRAGNAHVSRVKIRPGEGDSRRKVGRLSPRAYSFIG